MDCCRRALCTVQNDSPYLAKSSAALSAPGDDDPSLRTDPLGDDAATALNAAAAAEVELGESGGLPDADAPELDRRAERSAATAEEAPDEPPVADARRAERSWALSRAAPAAGGPPLLLLVVTVPPARPPALSRDRKSVAIAEAGFRVDGSAALMEAVRIALRTCAGRASSAAVLVGCSERGTLCERE